MAMPHIVLPMKQKRTLVSAAKARTIDRHEHIVFDRMSWTSDHLEKVIEPHVK
jgi:hypothetical protein